MTKLLTVAAAAALLLALATPAGASFNFGKNVPHHRQRRATFCDVVKYGMECPQKDKMACTGNCAINNDDGCEVSPQLHAELTGTGDLMKAIAGASVCGFSMAQDEAACKAASKPEQGANCAWQKGDDGNMACSSDRSALDATTTKIVQGAFICGFSMAQDEAACKAASKPEQGANCVWQKGGGGNMECSIDQRVILSLVKDPTMKKTMEDDYTCKQARDQAACNKDPTGCKWDGVKCEADSGKYTAQCLSAAAAEAGGNTCAGVNKIADMAVDCGAKTSNTTCTGICEWKDAEGFCEPSGKATINYMTTDPNGQATMAAVQKVTVECDKVTCDSSKATCSACTAKSDMCKVEVDGDASFATNKLVYKCDTDAMQMMKKIGCGSALSKMYTIQAKKSRAAAGKIAERSAAAKTKVEEAKKKVAACNSTCANKAELEAAVTTAEAEVTNLAAASARATADAATAEADAKATQDLTDTAGAGGLASGAATVLAGFAAALLSL